MLLSRYRVQGIITKTCIRHGSGTRGSPAIRKAPQPKSAGTAADSHLYKTFKPLTPSIRHLKYVRNDHLWPGKPVEQLTIPRRKTGGRNNKGRITVRHIGGGHKQRIRMVDFKRAAEGIQDVVRIEYDPGRSAHIALLKSRDESLEGHKKWSYILASDGLRAGHTVQSYQKGIPDGTIPGFKDVPGLRPGVDETSASGEGGNASALSLAILRATTIRVGNVLPLRLIPAGTAVHNIGLHPGQGGQLVRAAGTSGEVVDHDRNGKHTHVKLQSGEVRLINQEACATIGRVSNPLWENRNLGKAGRNRWLGRRPHVRGVAMNKVDHPHGGGRGKSKSNKHPRSPWGWKTNGLRTRKPKPKGPRGSNDMVLKERPRGPEKKALKKGSTR